MLQNVSKLELLDDRRLLLYIYEPKELLFIRFLSEYAVKVEDIHFNFIIYCSDSIRNNT